MKKKLAKIKDMHRWVKGDKKRLLLFLVVAGLAFEVILQLLWPSDRLLPWTTIDGINFGAWSKADAISRLTVEYKDQPISVYFGQDSANAIASTPMRVGFDIKSDDRVGAITYPWYLRLVPLSFIWTGLLTEVSDEYNYFVDNSVVYYFAEDHFSGDCRLAAVNASLKANSDGFELVGSQAGTECDVVKMSDGYSIVSTPVAAEVSDEEAVSFGQQLESKIDDLSLEANGQAYDVDKSYIYNAIIFNDGYDEIYFSVDSSILWYYLYDNFYDSVFAAAGDTTIHLTNYTETSRDAGADGAEIDPQATIENIAEYLHGIIGAVKIETRPIASSTYVYDRSYTDFDSTIVDIARRFDEENIGSYAVSLFELTGENRIAGYNQDQAWIPSSTYKLFVAYSTLLRIESGQYDRTDMITGTKSLERCFSDMIVYSDNICAEALIAKIGRQNLTDEAHAIGSVNTSFVTTDNLTTTAFDLANLLAQLQAGQILELQSDRDILIDAMKLNIYKSGIPSGVDGTVADKVGFLDNLLNDASIIYTDKGIYVLVIMTEGASWDRIAALAGEIQDALY